MDCFDGPSFERILDIRSFCRAAFWEFWSWWRFLQSSYSATGTLNLQTLTAWVPWGQPRDGPGFPRLCLPLRRPHWGLSSFYFIVTVASRTNNTVSQQFRPWTACFSLISEPSKVLLVSTYISSTCYLKDLGWQKLCYHWGLPSWPSILCSFSVSLRWEGLGGA